MSGELKTHLSEFDHFYKEEQLFGLSDGFPKLEDRLKRNFSVKGKNLIYRSKCFSLTVSPH